MILLLLLLVPLLELVVIVWVGSELGVLRTLGLLLLLGAAGLVLLVRAGVGAARRFRDDLARGAVPDRAALDTLLIVLAGILLLLPGFLSDVAAIWLLLPPGRAIARRSLQRGRGRRMAAATVIYDVRGRPVDAEPPWPRDPGTGDPRRLPPR